MQCEAQLQAMHRRLAVARQVKTGLLGKLYQVGSCYPRRDFARELLRIVSPPVTLPPGQNPPERHPYSPTFASRNDPHIYRKRAHACACECMARARVDLPVLLWVEFWHRCQNGESCGTSLNSRGTRRSTSHESASMQGSYELRTSLEELIH